MPFRALGIMVLFLRNPLPQLVLTFHTGLNHPKNEPELISTGVKRAVSLHHQTTKQTLKNKIMKIDSGNFGKLAIAALALSLAFTTPLLANEGGKDNPKTELKFIGNMENHPVFELNLANKVEDEYTVTFRDEYGNILFSDKFKGAGLSKKFILRSEEFGDAALNVTVKSKNANTTEVYSINRSHSYVEETLVNKVK
ncbi:hypothetical protein ABIE54_004639 [Chitinophagaceae bacterium OAS944]